ncbi:lysophospholipid acyltransferase family protein [Hymenobacter sp. H14-R3]|uniref:lysophospholipid acyltransferase family protein n=1 Tax=Hymenobacter sp. H14-R3 TaxID=3046308 RepID=UPI0024BA2CD8|nr:lysophospholipid acyltransferase family protein [Hymenobacter sp. H14-R3]MDJ0364305.1 lysophospholipid acyltransferase family protein [Hymenobacter sp. H14-R3]
MLFYTVMKPVVRLGLRVFFRRLEVRHPERLRLPGPLMLCSNHPNTLMDPLVTAIQRHEPIAFLAKSSFFKNPILGAIMRSGNCIPIYRRQDSEGSANALSPAQLTASNEASFGRCYDYLERGGTVMIFPEGTSVSERRLRPLKTGAARIALGTEARHDFKLGLKLVCVGTNYFDPSHFRSDVLLNVAAPIEVASYAARYREDPDAAADELTEEIRLRLTRRLVISRDAADDQLAQQVERTFGDHLNPDDDPTTLYDNFQLSRTLLDAVAWFEQHDPNRLADLRSTLTTYLADLEKYKLDDDALDQSQRPGTRLADYLNLVLGFPVWLYGLITNYVPYKIPSAVADRATKETEFIAAIMLGVGIVTFPLAYAVEDAAVQHWTHDWRLAALFVISLPLAGFYALGYWQTLSARLKRLRVRRLPAAALAHLQGQRTAILRLLDEAQAAYLSK